MAVEATPTPASPDRAPRARTPRATARRCSPRPREVFAERGVDASLEEIARRAGVGIGTLYRHFPTRDALIEAVYRREVESLCDGVDELLADHDPVDALSHVDAPLRRLRRAQARHGDGAEVGARRRTTSCSATATGASATRSARSSTPPSRPAQIRADVDAEDLLRAMSGICMATDTPGWAERTAPPGRPAGRRPALRRAAPA